MKCLCKNSLYLAPGLLLRLFSYWYEMDVVDEEAFLGWKEDISQEYPGKGDALFQVGGSWGLTSIDSTGERDQLMCVGPGWVATSTALSAFPLAALTH